MALSLPLVTRMLVSAWCLIPGLQLPAWKTSGRPLNLHLENEDCVTLGWDSPAIYQPWSVYTWRICLACLTLWIQFILLFSNGQNSQPWTQSSRLSFCPSFNRIFPPINIGLNPDWCSLDFTFLEGSQVEWRCAGKSIPQERVRLGRQISWHL